LEATNLGPIKHAQVNLGDLTVFVGPQATGKSILLEFLKLVLDSGAIVAELKRHGLDWSNTEEFLEIYLGERMLFVWGWGSSHLAFDGEPVNLTILVGKTSKRATFTESLFYIPAQRVLTLGRGWPRTFDAYEPGDPFVV